MEIARNFAPHEEIALALLPHALGTTSDAAHDMSHLLRVWRNVQIISRTEGGDGAVLAAATLLHDCVDVPKRSLLRSSASRMAAEKSLVILVDLGWQKTRAEMAAHAIEAHSFSAGIAARTLEARILQDADRLDAIGYVGIARCFHVSGQLGRSIYDPEDPIGSNRDLDDLAFAIDHFQTKLLRLSGSFLTSTGSDIAEERHKTVKMFMDGFLKEVSADPFRSG